jgi:hypothetical protein
MTAVARLRREPRLRAPLTTLGVRRVQGNPPP